jgi:lysozyme family protein
MTLEDLATAIMVREGWDAFTDDPPDPPTKFGITPPALTDYLGRPATKADIQALDEATAREVYRKVVFKPFEAITDARLLEVVLDTATLHGVHGAKQIVQRALDLEDDGVWGPVTLAAIKDSSPLVLGIRTLTARARDEADQVASNPEAKVKYLRGWTNRNMTMLEMLLS